MSELSHTLKLYERFEVLNETTAQEAAALAAQGRRATFWGLVVAPFLIFVRVYVKQKAWRSGMAGLIDAVFASYAAFVRETKLWEMNNDPDKTPPPPPPPV
jgi:hypothetical protein